MLPELRARLAKGPTAYRTRAAVRLVPYIVLLLASQGRHKRSRGAAGDASAARRVRAWAPPQSEPLWSAAK